LRNGKGILRGALVDTTGKSEDEEEAYPGGLVKELDTSLEAIGGSTDFYLIFLLLGTYIKPYKKQRRNTRNNIIVIFFCLLSYKIDKYGEVVAEPI
jgi:hypothetical protein